MSKKVLIGLSGGVDSAVAAHLLKKQGYEVTGCFMRNWDSILNNDIKGNPTLSGSKCSQELDYDDAVLTAKQLNINIERIDFVQEYWNDVFTYFLDEYKKGRTPNPDIFCNKYIKFEAFRKYAFQRGYDYIAMGHYAKKICIDGHCYLYKADDKNKDQSYFLAQINEEQLSSCLFPLESLNKSEVRKIAEDLGLSIAKKRDSTGVCFIGERNFHNFLQNYIPATEGDIIDVSTKKIVGRHDGVYYYTIGQHRGLAIGGQQGFVNKPFYVVGKDAKRNILFVGQEPNEFSLSYSCRLSHINILDKTIDKEFKASAKFRYREKDKDVNVEIQKDEILLRYDGYKYITPGQLAVIYIGERLVCSGIIEDLYDREGKLIDFSKIR